MTTRTRIQNSDLEVFPLALGTNVFGWTADEEASHAVLDDYYAAGGNFLDTSDSYSFWAPGNVGGEAETIIAGWLAKRDVRDQIVLATKVSQHPDFKGLAPATVHAAVEASLRRLGTEVIDLYYAHFDDEATPLEESIAALSGLVDSGKVRYVGISNYTPERIKEWLRITEAGGYARPVVIQPQYSLVERGIEEVLLPLAQREGLATTPYYALARGFLTGKYRHGADDTDSPRADAASRYLDDLGRRVLAALDEISSAHHVAPATIALAWLASRPTVVAPIASARTPEQLPALLAHVDVSLTTAELDRLTEASNGR